MKDLSLQKKSLERLLGHLDLNDKESKLFIMSLELGVQPASVLARKTGIPRSSVFFPLRSLIRKGFMSKRTKAGISYFQPVSVNALKERFDENVEKAKRCTLEFDALSPIIASMQVQQFPFSSKIEYFEGLEGIKNIYADIMKSDFDLYVITGHKIHPEIRKHLIEQYVPHQKKSKRKSYLIVNDSTTSREYLQFARDIYEEIYLVPDHLYSLQLTMRIYGNKLALVSSYDKDNVTGLIIENQVFADHMRTIFNMLRHFLKNTKIK